MLPPTFPQKDLLVGSHSPWEGRVCTDLLEEGAALQNVLRQMWLSGGWQHKLMLKVRHVGVKPGMQ